MLTELFFFFFRLCVVNDETVLQPGKYLYGNTAIKKKKKANFVMDNTQLIQLKVRIKILEFYQIL